MNSARTLVPFLFRRGLLTLVCWDVRRVRHSARFQGKHALNSLLHICAREGYLRMVTTLFDDRTRIPADRDVPILVDARNQRGRTPLHVRKGLKKCCSYPRAGTRGVRRPCFAQHPLGFSFLAALGRCFSCLCFSSSYRCKPSILKQMAFGPPTISFNGLLHGLDPAGLKAAAPRPDGVAMDTDWVKPGDHKTRRKVVQTLIAEGADYEARDIMDFMPLHYAATWG